MTKDFTVRKWDLSSCLGRDSRNVVGGWAYIKVYEALISIVVAGRDCRDLFGVMPGSRLHGEENDRRCGNSKVLRWPGSNGIRHRVLQAAVPPYGHVAIWVNSRGVQRTWNAEGGRG